MEETKTVADNFFVPAANTKPYFKAAFEGFAGSGKSFTAAQVAVGLWKRIKSDKPVIIFDTEKSSKFLKPLFEKEGIALLVKESRSLADLKETMARMRQGISDVLIIDSISHVWENFLEAYKQKVHRTGLQFQDWGIIKPSWKTEFSDPFVRDSYHVIMTGRAGYEYENEINEDTKKREIYKSGIKMKVEGETAYEPDILVLMERIQEMDGATIKRVIRTGTVIKDRADLIDGKVFENPSYDNFSPAVEAMLENPVLKDVVLTPERDAGLLFRTEEEKGEFRRDRDKCLEEIDGLLTRVFPGNTGKDKQAKLDILDFVFGTTSETAIREFMPERLRAGYKAIMDWIVAKGLAKYVSKESGGTAFVIPRKDPEVAEAKVAPEQKTKESKKKK